MTHVVSSNEYRILTKCVVKLHGCFKFHGWNIATKIPKDQSEDSLLHVVTIGPQIANILWARNPILLEHDFLVSILNYKPCHIPHKYGYPIKKSDHIKAHAIKIHWHLFGVGLIGPNVQWCNAWMMLDFQWQAIIFPHNSLSPSSVDR